MTNDEHSCHGKEEEHMAYDEASSYNSQDVTNNYRNKG